MKTRPALLIAALALSACAPSVIGANERSIVIGKVDITNRAEAFALADQHCRKYGLVARMSGFSDWSSQQNYDCVR
jgi:hypothetical protein